MTAMVVGGCTGKSGGARAHGRRLLLVRALWLNHWPRGRSPESLVMVVVVPPSLRVTERKKETGNAAMSGKPGGSNLGKTVDLPVGAPVYCGEQLAVAFLGDSYGKVRFVSRHPR